MSDSTAPATAAPAVHATPELQGAQLAAAREADSLRPVIAKNITGVETLGARNRYAALTAFIRGDGPEPTGLQVPAQNASTDGVSQAPKPQKQNTMANPLAAAWAPMQESDFSAIEAEGKVHGVPSVAATNLTRALHAAGMPASLAKQILQRAGHHTTQGAGVGGAPLDAEEHKLQKEDAIRRLGGGAKAQQTAREVIQYLNGLPKESAALVQLLTRTSLGLDGKLLHMIASYARSRASLNSK